MIFSKAPLDTAFPSKGWIYRVPSLLEWLDFHYLCMIGSSLEQSRDSWCRFGKWGCLRDSGSRAERAYQGQGDHETPRTVERKCTQILTRPGVRDGDCFPSGCSMLLYKWSAGVRTCILSCQPCRPQGSLRLRTLGTLFFSWGYLFFYPFMPSSQKRIHSEKKSLETTQNHNALLLLPKTECQDSTFFRNLFFNGPTFYSNLRCI